MSAGLTLRERLTKDKQAAKDGEKIEFSHAYYSRLDAQYSTSDDVKKLLQLKPGENISDGLKEAFKSMQSKPANRSLMRTWFETADGDIDRASLKVGLLALNGMKASASTDQLHTGLAVMRACARAQEKDKYEDLLQMMGGKFDEFLLQAWLLHAHTQVTNLQFIKVYTPVVFLSLPRAEAELIDQMAPDATLMSHKTAFKTLAASSKLGERLFSSAVRRIVTQEVQETVDSAISRVMDKAGPLTEVELRRHQRSITETVESIEGIKMIDARRTVRIEYRGIPIDLPVKSLADEVNLRVMTRVRAALAASEALLALPGERALLGDAKGASVATLTLDCMPNGQLTRSTFVNFLKEEPKMSAEVILVHAHVKKHTHGRMKESAPKKQSVVQVNSLIAEARLHLLFQ
eukprot:6489879-Amphidinium_carterae.2